MAHVTQNKRYPVRITDTGIKNAGFLTKNFFRCGLCGDVKGGGKYSNLPSFCFASFGRVNHLYMYLYLHLHLHLYLNLDLDL